MLIVVGDGWVSSEKGMGRIDVFRVGVIWNNWDGEDWLGGKLNINTASFRHSLDIY